MSFRTGKFKDFYSILRFVDTDEEGNSVLNFDGAYTYFRTDTQTGQFNDNIIDYSDSVKSRLKYSKLYIEKIVDKKDNNIVEPGDELTYKILIKNESK
ncbi:hypothetical protein J5751_02235 [bacterium]|nr:hypothetical protein [bacterium]